MIISFTYHIIWFSDGFKSVEGMGADGYELDIYKTKDNKLVVIHDDDTLVSWLIQHLLVQ